MSTLVRANVQVFLLLSLIIRHGVTGFTHINKDPGENLTVTWSKLGNDARCIENITLERFINDLLVPVLHCFDLDACSDESYRRIGVKSISWYYGDLERIGFFINDVNLSDAGMYIFKYFCGCDNKWQYRNALLYVYQKPTKPVITSTVRTHETVLTCNSRPQSKPEGYRNNSYLEYAWTVNGSTDNYRIDGNKIRISNPRNANPGSSICCTARELNSTLISEESDPVFLENIQINATILDDVREKVALSCTADCNPGCTYEWLDPEGRKIVVGQEVMVLTEDEESRVSCQAKNALGTLSQSVNFAIKRASLYRRRTVISLSVFCLLSLGVAVLAGVMLLLYKRREKHRTTNSENDTNTSAGKEEPRQQAGENTEFHSNSAYEELDQTRDNGMKCLTVSEPARERVVHRE